MQKFELGCFEIKCGEVIQGMFDCIHVLTSPITVFYATCLICRRFRTKIGIAHKLKKQGLEQAILEALYENQ